MTRTQSRRVPHSAIRLGMILAVSSAVGGCYFVDETGIIGPEQFCGYLYSCGNHGGSDDNTQGSSDSTSSTSSSSSSSNSTGGEGTTSGEGTTPTGGE